jgi:hypothetical protein
MADTFGTPRHHPVAKKNACIYKTNSKQQKESFFRQNKKRSKTSRLDAVTPKAGYIRPKG